MTDPPSPERYGGQAADDRPGEDRGLWAAG